MPEEAAKPVLLSLSPELPGDTPIELLDMAPRVQQVLRTEGLKTVGEVRETSDDVLLSFQNLGVGSVS